MKMRLFPRLFLAYTLALLVTVCLLASTMVILVRNERQIAYEAEVRLQARDVAQLLQARGANILWRFDGSLGTALTLKLNDLRDNYDADVWVVMNNEVLMLNNPSNAKKQPNDPKVLEQIRRVLDGNEIRAQGLFDELGDSVVTIGVPWQSPDGYIMGAVLMHVSVQSLAVDYSDILRYAGIAGVLAMLLGVVLSSLLARQQTRPIKHIHEAVSGYAAGDFSTRIDVKGSAEIVELSQSINRMAEDLSNLEDSRKSFVANVSHELRSPLTCIQGYVQGMLDGTIEEAEKDKYLDIVLSETQRLTRLVSDLLALSRMESGKFPLSMTTFDINEMLLEALFKYEKKIEEKGIAVEISFREQPLMVEADADRIQQVVSNLVDNAVKYTRSQITVWTHAAEGQCYITLTNDGPGIPQDDLPFIFDRFYKVDKAHTSGMGTGLGLSIVKRILEQHGQTITCTSTQEKTSMVFTLHKAKNAKGES